MYESRHELLLIRAHEDGSPPRDAWVALAQEFAWIHRVGVAEALPTAVAGTFDCVLIEAPSAQALEILTSFRDALPHLPVVVLALVDDPECHRQALRLGAQDVLLVDRLQPRLTRRTIEFAIERQQHWMSTAADATWSTSREQEVKRNAQSERLAALGRLTGGIAHEINNPVALLAANLEFLRLKMSLSSEDVDVVVPLEGRASALLGLFDDCREAIGRISAIVADLHACSRFAEDELEAVDLVEIVESACAALPTSKSTDAVIVTQLQAVPPLLGHRGKLLQVALAVLSHALEAASSPRSERGRVVISTRAEAKHVVLCVEDGGYALSEELRERLFDPFFHGSSRDRRGLGLALASEIIRGHRGEIRIGANVGHPGSRFEVHIPIADGASARIVPPLKRVRPRSSEKPRLLLIDDEPAFLRALARLLTRVYDVQVASSGSEALELSPSSFDVIVCDLMMPNMDGPTFFDQLSKRHPDARSRVIFVTGGAFRDEVRRFIENVPNPVLHKPFATSELVDTIERLLGTTRPTTQLATVAS